MRDNTSSLNSSMVNNRHNLNQQEFKRALFNLLFDEPCSRRMAATKLGYTDQTYMVTQTIYDWIKEGRAAVVGQIKCHRSNRLVQSITTNQDLFPKSNQLTLF
ncbi:MAG: hypothetical protein ACSHWW_14130 [Nonlabens sp.]|uniref:hypothetical protein n=1 Tax=Nonlabens sp. TaxID=1888209 RepID=UPI003EF0BED4